MALKSIGFSLALLTLCLSASAARAVPITWYLSGVTFNDGGTASGHFQYDADSDTMFGVSITTTAGTDRSGTTYSQPFNGPPVNDDISTFFDSLVSDLTGVTILQLAYASPLTNAGGSIEILQFSDEGTCFDAGCTGISPPIRLVASGLVVTTPEPATLALLTLGMAGIGYHRRKRLTA